MLTDKQNWLSNEEQFNVAAASDDTTENHYDLGPMDSGNSTVGLGVGQPTLYGYILVKSDFAASGGAANVTFTLESSASTGLGSSTVHWTSGAIAKGTLVDGYRIVFTLPVTDDYKQYVFGRVDPDTNDLDGASSNKIDWFITDNVDVFNAYADGRTFLT